MLSGIEREKPVLYRSEPPADITKQCPRLPEPPLDDSGHFKDEKQRLAWALSGIALLLQCQYQHDEWREFREKQSKTTVDH